MVSHLHGRNRSKEKTELEIEQEERAKGRGRTSEVTEGDDEGLNESESSKEMQNKKHHQRGFGKNQDKEPVDRAPNYSSRPPGQPQV